MTGPDGYRFSGSPGFVKSDVTRDSILLVHRFTYRSEGIFTFLCIRLKIKTSREASVSLYSRSKLHCKEGYFFHEDDNSLHILISL